ncbi:Isochorismatase-like protein [Protomyces lactucae-debilis]|uniref:nicotinamidase n=1 Tax=Protomyces lactucae-debilis TaxID=2754530 RepID=A0A1Y2FJQ1_PROLT|nr:Isochorismatase-like protein [Protomyces lactucae-debilis]ORY83604.1 Isochorismatase-like protein [Protomyces lactucae-debilis]
MPKTALLIVDVQNDFLDGGALAVPHAEEIIPVIQRLLNHPFDQIIATQDWHPRNHVSFAANHKGDMQSVRVTYKNDAAKTYTQRLWPVHCVQGTHGADLHPEIARLPLTKIVQKGYNADVDSYSAFSDCLGIEETGLEQYLQEHNIRRILCVGIAEDYCVFETALAAGQRGFETAVLREGVKGIEEMSGEKQTSLANAKIRYVTRADVAEFLRDGCATQA